MYKEKKKRYKKKCQKYRFWKYFVKNVFFICGFCVSITVFGAEEKTIPKIGVCVYNASVLNGIKEAVIEEEAELIVAEDVRDQNLQIGIIQDMIDQGIDVLIANAIHRTASVYLIRMAQEAEIPIILVNSEPLREDLFLYEDAYYIGSNATMIGKMCGQIAADYYYSHPDMDQNQDGILQMVLIKGQIGHQDAEYRTRYSLLQLEEEGIPVEILAEDSAEWERDQANEKMAVALEIYGDKIECVICNNDQMAFGVIDALRAAGYYQNGKKLPVIGVDGLGTSVKDALEEGSMIGTVLNDTRSQGRIAYHLALQLGQGKDAGKEVEGYPIEEGHYIWITGSMITNQKEMEE